MAKKLTTGSKKRRFRMRSEIFQYPGMAGWFFLTLPTRQSQIIKTQFGITARGWGSLPVEVTIGGTTWKTSIFPDRRAGAYLLPLKAAVRRAEDLHAKDIVAFSILLR